MNCELKLIFQNDAIAGDVFKLIKGLGEIEGYALQLREEVVNTDHYFDSPDLALEREKVVCRIRQAGNNYKKTLKRQVLTSEGEMKYVTRDVEISKDEFSSYLNGKHFPFDEILPVFIQTERAERLVKIENQREVLRILQNDTEVGTMSLDWITYFDTEDREIKKDYEIELKGQQEEYILPIANFLSYSFNLLQTTQSKLSRIRPFIKSLKQTGPKKVILDMDPGVDDALALLLALSSPELDIKAITIVGGNVGVKQCARNVYRALDFVKELKGLGSSPPVGIGEEPSGEKPDASDVHGRDGLGNLDEYKIYPPAREDISDCPEAKDLIKRIVEENPGEVTIITTGPLTNIASCIKAFPETMKRVKEIVSMGGVFFDCGNRSPTAEFNIHSDPASAKQVVEFCREPKYLGKYRVAETVPLTFVGLDVTHRVRLYRKRLEEALAGQVEDTNPYKILKFIRDFTRVYMDFYKRNEGLDGCYLHDPLTVGYVIDPSLCVIDQYHVEVAVSSREDGGNFVDGMTVADYRPTRIFKCREREVTWVCVKVDTKRFEEFILERILNFFRKDQ